VRRTIDDALWALRQQVKAWATGAKPDIRVFVYPPEWEARMLARLGPWAAERAAEELVVQLVDCSLEWLRVIEDRGAEQALLAEEKRSEDRLRGSLRALGHEAVMDALTRPLPDGIVARILTNTGALATTVSFSAITNDLHGAASGPTVPAAICFPGEGDDRALSLLGLRPDTNYRVPRI
jgi:hypothetical protein